MAISDRIAVMHQGRIVQEGTAEVLYHQPGSEFVAQFIGRTNLLTGRALSVDPSGVEVEVAGQRLRLAAPPAGIAPGQSLRLVLRPEVIALGPTGAQGAIPGTIVSRTFLGEKTEYVVRVGADVLQVTRYDPAQAGRFSPGDRVGLHLPPAGVPLLPGGTK